MGLGVSKMQYSTVWVSFTYDKKHNDNNQSIGINLSTTKAVCVHI